jgi:hypothetical protein
MNALKPTNLSKQHLIPGAVYSFIFTAFSELSKVIGGKKIKRIFFG